jgi:hypothetical protein
MPNATHDKYAAALAGGDVLMEIQKGNIDKHSFIHQFGANSSVGTTEEDIWINGGPYPFPITAETIRIKAGGNVNDDAGGTGARTINVQILDENWEIQNITLNTNGISAGSPSVLLARRILDASVAGVGTYGGANTGAIIIENTTSGQVLANIAPGRGHTQLSMFTVPANHVAVIQNVDVTGSSTQTASVYMYKREEADIVAAPYRSKVLLRAFLGITDNSITDQNAVILAEKTDVWFSGVTPASTAQVDVTYDLILIDVDP